MPDAVIVSTARTRLAKSWRGAFNMTHGATMGGHVVQARDRRARGIDPGEVDDVLIGCAIPEGATGRNIARQIALRRRLSGVDRRCDRSTASARRACRRSRIAAQRIIAGEGDIYVGRRRRIDLLRAERDRTSTCCARPGSSSTSRRSTGRCCRRPRLSPSATASRASGRTSTARAASSARAAAARRQVQRRDRADDR